MHFFCWEAILEACIVQLERPSLPFVPGMGCYFEDIKDLSDGDKMLSLNAARW